MDDADRNHTVKLIPTDSSVMLRLKFSKWAFTALILIIFILNITDWGKHGQEERRRMMMRKQKFLQRHNVSENRRLLTGIPLLASSKDVRLEKYLQV